EIRLGGLVDARAPDFPLIQNLQGGFARAVARILLDVFHWRFNWAMTVAISTAATAASQPLLAGPSPARSMASSTEFVVKTPNAIGTPVAAAAAVMPCDTAELMYSKCAVAPRMRQPRQITASNFALSAAWCAASVISNAPGTFITVIPPLEMPSLASAARAPVSSRSVTKSLYFETTTA